MIRHCVMFRWANEATAEQKQAIRENIIKLPERIEGVKSFSTGDDIGVNEGNFDFCATADFDSEEDYILYRDHPFHLDFIATYVRPAIAERAAVQFAF